ncbi:MAG: hypothetical protein Q7T13_01680 [Polaromonas sp.]|nr:hypothetical protein [Polaromonas sp.]
MDNPIEKPPKETPYQKGKRHAREAFERKETKEEREKRLEFNAAQEALDEGRIKPVLIDTGNVRKAQQYRVSKSETSAARDVYTKIPKRLDAMYLSLADTSAAVGGSVLTREELELNPKTKILSPQDKDALIRFWPTYVTHLERVREIKAQREEETALALKAGRAGLRFLKKNGYESMDTAEQMDALAGALKMKAHEIAAGLLATADVIHTDQLSMTLAKQRMSLTKDFIWLGRNFTEEAMRIRNAQVEKFDGSELSEQTLKALQQADEMLAGRGFQSGAFTDADVK